MPKPTGDKNFMVLSKTECLNASKHLLENAESLYNDAVLLAGNNSYGRATSMLIHSTEETMKALILFLDSKGFQFRNKVSGINNLFVNHSLRYGLAMIVSVLHVFSEDLNKFLQNVRNDPQSIIELHKNKKVLENKFFEYFKNKIKIVLQEVIWFSKAEFLRQDGFYVDYVNEIKTPLNINKKDYEDVLLRIDGMRTFVTGLIDSFNSEDELFIEQTEELKSQFINETWYGHLGKLIDKFKNKKINPLEDLSTVINEFSDEIETKKSFND